MNATTVAVDLAKNVFELAVADRHWKIVERQRLTRGQFERWFANRSVGLVVMEACGSAHHWARWLGRLGIEVRLLPPRYVRPYVKRNKTDAADAAALLEAHRCADIAPVRVKSVEQQALQSLHRVRSRWMATRTARLVPRVRHHHRAGFSTRGRADRSGAGGPELSDPEVAARHLEVNKPTGKCRTSAPPTGNEAFAARAIPALLQLPANDPVAAIRFRFNQRLRRRLEDQFAVGVARRAGGDDPAAHRQVAASR
jgi:hypothetical protein